MSNFHFDVRRVQDANTLLSVLSTLNGDASGAASIGQATLVLPPATLRLWFKRSGSYPATLLWVTPTEVYVFIDGVRTTTQGLNFYLATTQPMSPTPWGGVHSMVQQVASRQFAQIISELSGDALSWTVCGYSYGGCLAEALAALASQDRKQGGVQILTFGSPRPGDAEFASALSVLRVRRWMNDADPIPRFPPTFAEAPEMSAAQGPVIAYLWSLYSQPAGGVELRSDGTLSPRTLPGSTLPITGSQLVAWVTGADAFGSAGHALSTYSTRMALAVRQTSLPATDNTSASGPQLGEPLLASQFAESVAAFQSAIARSLSLVEGKGMVIPPNLAPKVYFVNGIYTVNWMGYAIAHCPTKSHANTIRKYLRKWLTTMVDADTIFSGSVQNGFRDWLTQAANPASGIVPTLTVE